MNRHWLPLLLLLALSACQLVPALAPTATPLPTATLAPLPTSTRPAPTALPTSAPIPTLTLAATPLPSGPLLLVSQTLAESKTKPAYTFTVNYPQIQNAGSPGLTAFNQASQKLATDLMASYQANIKNNPPIATPEPGLPGSFMEAKYQVIHGSDGLLSIRFTIADYWSGAAHPNSYSMVLNFNLITGQPLALKDLFLPGAGYLQTIADFCAADLQKRDRLGFPEGVAPKAENFQNWAIADQGLIFYFDPYQVAAYAMGPQKVSIPYSALKPILNPTGPLAPLLQ